MKERIVRIQHYSSPCGEMVLGSLDDRLCLCNWVVEKHPGRVDRRLRNALEVGYEASSSPVVRKAMHQLDDYFLHGRREFDIPLLLVGTDFQKSVWKQLLEIPYGETVSYAELAVRLGRPDAVRAVANANGANAISIFVPCHRVIGSGQTLTGYGGGLEAKRFLLELEQAGWGSSSWNPVFGL